MPERLANAFFPITNLDFILNFFERSGYLFVFFYSSFQFELILIYTFRMSWLQKLLHFLFQVKIERFDHAIQGLNFVLNGVDVSFNVCTQSNWTFRRWLYIFMVHQKVHAGFKFFCKNRIFFFLRPDKTQSI